MPKMIPEEVHEAVGAFAVVPIEAGVDAGAVVRRQVGDEAWRDRFVLALFDQGILLQRIL